MAQLLKKYDVVFPKDIPHGLPPKKGSEYNIYLIQGSYIKYMLIMLWDNIFI